MNKFEKISNSELLGEIQRRIEIEEGAIGFWIEIERKVLYLEDLKTGTGFRLDIEKDRDGKWVNKEWLKALIN
ncbi:MAG: hypothetical protein MRERV_7c055 [Mycoplasmataceae bacterium RV_VA103A]|nr:MAG: hypothetical protein MRERV_7c055 [Mycoplasmataceae bacterium RV_VA103A]